MNPRRPTPSGPEPDPFDLARAPPLSPKYDLLCKGVKSSDLR